MINTENIGRKIRILRQQKHISQERMALDLGLYQADISNLERATGNSGITDIAKLDMIAEYFSVQLTDLLTEKLPEPAHHAPINVKLKEYEPSQYIISETFYNKIFDITASCFVSEVVLEAPGGLLQYVAFIEDNQIIHFYQSKSSLFEGLRENGDNKLFIEKLTKNCFLSGNGYDEVFAKVEQRWIDICRYLIYVATERTETVEPLVESAKGKKFCEIVVPIPRKEPEELMEVDYSNLSAVYRYRLIIETALKNPSVYDDLENFEMRIKKTYEKVKAACISEDAYKLWKKDLIDAKVESLIKTEKIITCDYVFAGIGQYKAIIRECELDSFKCWINGNGSAFFCGSRPATKRELRTYAAEQIMDDLL